MCYIKKTFIVVLITAVLSMLISTEGFCSQPDRANDLLERCHIYHDPDGTDPVYVAQWCLATLYLGTDNPNITSSDITKANNRLDDMDDSSQFDQIPVTPGDEGDLPRLYWTMPHLAAVLSNSTIYERTTTPAKESIRQVLADFVQKRDKYAETGTGDDDIYNIRNSMNHDWLSKSIFLLTAQKFKNLPSWENIYDDGYDAQQHYEAWNAHLKKKIQNMAIYGMDPEIASPTYTGITLQGLFNIRDYAQDLSLSYIAEDYISLILADGGCEAFEGVRGGGKTRVYKDDYAYDGDRDGFQWFTHLLADTPTNTPTGGVVARTIVGACISDYTLPGVIRDLITDVGNRTFAHTSRRFAHGSNIVENDIPIYNLEFPCDLRRYTYGTPDYVIGSFAIDETKPEDHYTLLNRQNQWMGMVCSADPVYSRVYFQVGQIGTHDPPTYGDLNAIQHAGGMLIRRQVTSSDTFFCFMSDDFRTNRVGPSSSTDYWIFSKNSDSSVYVALKAVDAAYFGYYTIDTSKPGYADPLYVEFDNSDTTCAFQAAQASDYAGFNDFQNDVKARVFRRNGSNEVEYQTLSGKTLKMYDDGSLSKLDGNSYGLNISKTYDGNYLYNDYYGDKTIDIKDPSGNSLELDFNYCTEILSADLNKDCYVNWQDFVLFAEQWLICTDPEDIHCW